MRFADAPPPKIIDAGNGLYLDEPASTSQKDAYAFCFSPAWDAAKERMVLVCRVNACKVRISYHVVGGDGKAAFPFTNAFQHLKLCGHNFLRREDMGGARAAALEEEQAPPLDVDGVLI